MPKGFERKTEADRIKKGPDSGRWGLNYGRFDPVRRVPGTWFSREEENY